MLADLFREFVDGRNPILEVAHVEIDQDEELARIHAEKIERAKLILGERYLMHPANRVERKAE